MATAPTPTPVRVTYSDESGFPAGIPGDKYLSYTEDGAPAAPSNLIKSVYQGSTFSVKLTFEVIDQVASTGETVVYNPATSVACTTTAAMSSIGLTVQNTGANSLTISGTVNNAFDTEFYTYLLSPENTITISAINNTDVGTFYSVVKYQDPTLKEIEKTYSFTVIYLDPLTGIQTTEYKDIYQWIYWNYAVSMAKFSAEVNKGIK